MDFVDFGRLKSVRLSYFLIWSEIIFTFIFLGGVTKQFWASIMLCFLISRRNADVRELDAVGNQEPKKLLDIS